ncbi:uncharacterized protein LDX57_001156 [Aspergillus melleus]|uniref:uncharacterized protein n=1 Tax=Aspergillus melleus TaxID=138277 RepID=UPI001E8CEFDD|nr:uncharacterized protein LDX57_001156 [Aspergillus melleus]KAH8423397.1 hypothetical protein LDX57_001156 [Aspergillus melleus]
MDPDTSPSPADQPPIFNYVLSFLLVGVAWGFTTPFIRRAAADFNARQELHQQSHDESPSSSNPQDRETVEEQELQSRRQRRHRDEAHSEQETEPLREGGSDSDEDGDEDHPPPEARPAWMNQDRNQGRSLTSSVKTKGKSSWLKTKIVGVFWTVVNLLRTPAYAIPLVVNLTGSVWFFLLVGKHELSLTVPLANSSAFLFTVLGEWYVERKVIEKETWLGMALVLGGIAICVKSKGS